MSKTIFPWVKPLGLSSNDFSNKPEGEDTLVWGLKNGIISPDDYTIWASESYKLPAIQAEFFSMAVDFSLLEKYSDIYDWNAYCYPIYQWENITYIACLEPLKLEINMKTCFVIAPFHALQSAWQKNEKSKPGDQSFTEQLPNPPSSQSAIENIKPISEADMSVESLDFGELKDELGISEEVGTPQLRIEKTPEKTEVDELDFSAISHDVDSEQNVSDTEISEKEGEEITQTKIDSDLNQLTSATQTMHASAYTTTQDTKAPDLPFDTVTIKGITLEGEIVAEEPLKEEKTKVQPLAENSSDKKAIPIPPPQPGELQQEKQQVLDKKVNDELSLPSLDDLKAHQTKNPQQAPGLDDDNIVLEQNSETDQNFDDDYTPVPIITKAQQEAQALRKAEAIKNNLEEEEESRLIENTITDHSQPIHTPPENQITEGDIKSSDELENAQSMKLVIAHFFGHLKRDYKKLMWVEKNSGDLYFPKYVYGDWKITTLAWRMHMNTINPNIFKVAYSSGLPFHGEISSNPYNDKYFEWWCRGKTPNFATIYPIKLNEEIIGFICGFGINSEFDQLGSLKKIENLNAICKKALTKQNGQKAA